MRRALVAAALALLVPSPAQAAGLGFSLPKARMLTLDGATSWGGSVQVVAGSFNVGMARIDLALDYGYTRDFGAAANYAFFDGMAGVGVPLGLGPQFVLTPSLYGHVLPFVASPVPVTSPLFGVGPRLTGAFKPAANVSVELGLGYDFVVSRGGMATLDVGGTYNF
ncbi:MAG: hypothetical protein JWM80_135 [Cyanobacteria bacterium RYN_339]|nr:hypothetical protein [Cyanobacteria bacterium RYN_339]